jgi:hypothetical protein
MDSAISTNSNSVAEVKARKRALFDAEDDADCDAEDDCDEPTATTIPALGTSTSC